MKTNRSLASYISLLIVAAMLLGNGVAPPASAQGVIVLTISGGDGQSALIGTAYAAPLQVTVTSDGTPVAGVEVRFSAPSSGASLNPAAFTATTDASGVASATATANWWLGSFEVSASFVGVSAVFHLTNLNPSRCECNVAVVDPRKCAVCAAETTQAGCEKNFYCWWRQTDAQNALADHSLSEWTGTTSIPDFWSGLKVYLYSAAGGSNVTVLTTPHNALIIGTGGDQALTRTARDAFRDRIPGFLRMTLSGIVLPDANKDSYWGASIWLSAFGKPDATIYASASFSDAYLRRVYVLSEWDERESYANGSTLAWGSDLFLGAGWAREYRPATSSTAPPNQLIEAPTDILVENETITLIPHTAGAGGLAVWVPRVKVLIVGNMGAYLPTLGGVAQAPVPVDEQLDALDGLKDLGATLLVMEHGLPVSGAGNVSAVFTAQYDALNYLKDETLKAINRHQDIEDIVNEVHLGYDLIGPYTREFAGSEAFAIRQIYTEYIGWFDGDVAHLESLSQREEDVRLMDLAGGQNPVLNYVKKCLTEHTRSGAIAALDYLGPLRRVYPSTTADAYYVQALKMLAWTTPSAELRNYYLTEVCRLEGTCLAP